MILSFPDDDTFRLVITSQVVSPNVLGTPVEAVWTDDEALIVGTSAKVSRAESSQLKKLGVTSRRSMPRAGRIKAGCWQQLLPLESKGESLSLNEQTPVLFELQYSSRLGELVGEMLRLGNDRQAYLHLGGARENRTLLRVNGPPYYTLLRALDHLGGEPQGNGEASLIAYQEQSSRVWVQLGRQHPLGSVIAPPPGQFLLISGERDWQYFDEQPFQDIYHLTKPQLPEAVVEFSESPCAEQIEVPLRLTAGSPNDPAELWVLRNNGMEQVEKLLESTDDKILSQLSFSVIHRDDHEPMVVLRTRPSRLAPPVLVLDATPYRTFSKLKNLFVPIGRRIHPPLRRDTIAKLLADDASMITWLHPQDDGQFIPESAPDRAFRPINEWVAYVLDHAHVSMQTWVDAHQFEFQDFVCEEKRTKKAPPAAGERTKQKKKDQKKAGKKSSAKPKDVKFETPEDQQQTLDDYEFKFQLEQAPAERTALQKQLESAEQEFIASDEPIDSEWRRAAWHNLAQLNATLGNRLDTSICFSNALWDTVHCDPRVTSQWLAAELEIASEQQGLDRSLGKLLPIVQSKPLMASVVAAVLTNAVATEDTADVQQHLSEVNQYLRQHEDFLPIRTGWLAWHALYQITGDTLALARARDRMLERLFQSGLAPESNLPSFLRARGAGQSERYRAMLEQVRELESVVVNWIVEAKTHTETAQTRNYARLTFAFAMARLGETGECQRVLEEVVPPLAARDEIHGWLSAAYQARIEQALRGETAAPMPDALVQQLEEMERMNRFKVDRLRSLSRIVEPHEGIDAFTKWHGTHDSELNAELAKLSSITDAQVLRGKLTAILERYGNDASQRLDVLPKALELSPRLGEQFARELLGNALQWLESCDDIVKKALLLNKSLYIAAHYGQGDAMQSLVDAMYSSLPKIVNEYFVLQKKRDTQDKDKIDTIEDLFTESFRDLRKMGMRDEIGRLYSELSNRVEQGREKVKKQIKEREAKQQFDARAMRLQLCAASGWYYFGQDKEAAEVADQVCAKLFANELKPMEQRGLACAYVTAVAQANEQEALQRIQAIFEMKSKKTRVMDGIADNMTTASHFSITQLDVIESAILALVSEDFSLSPESRRWVDEDEFLVRKRIHEDVRREF